MSQLLNIYPLGNDGMKKIYTRKKQSQVMVFSRIVGLRLIALLSKELMDTES